MRIAHISVERIDVGHELAERALPSVPVRIDKAWHDNGVVGVDRLCVSGAEVGTDGHDAVALDEQVGAYVIANGGVHGENGCALEERSAGLSSFGHGACTF
jgi:hypothetical protein